MDPASYSNYAVSISGESFGGIGVYLGIDDNGLPEIISVIEGAPADLSGLLAGDKITSVDGVATQNMASDEVVGRIRGEPGSVVTLEIYRGSVPDNLVFNVTRAVIDVPYVSCESMSSNAGYIKITSFTSAVPAQFDDAFASLQTAGMESLIVDLRGNPGGLLSAAIQTADRFIASGVIVTRENRNGETTIYTADGSAYIDIPVYVLINEYSASSSEILAGALKDHGAAQLIGTTSYGKGTVQTVFTLSNNGAVLVTTDRYLTPSGFIVDGNGITPDHAVAPDEADILNGIDTQLEYALDLIESQSLQRDTISGAAGF